MMLFLKLSVVKLLKNLKKKTDLDDFDLILEGFNEEIANTKKRVDKQPNKVELSETLVEDFRPRFLGKLNESPNPQEYKDGTMYKDTRTGTVYIAQNGLWESLVEDGKPGAQGRQGAAGSGTGVKEVETIVKTIIQEKIYYSYQELISETNLPINTEVSYLLQNGAKMKAIYTGNQDIPYRLIGGSNLLNKKNAATLGDSIFAVAGNHADQAIMSLGYTLSYRGAVAGTTIQQQQIKIPSIISAGCGTVFVHVGTNNMNDTGAVIYSSYMQLFNELYLNGFDVVVSLPGSRNQPYDSIMYKIIVACYFAANKYGFRVFDVLGKYSTENSGWQVGKSLDDVHPHPTTRSEAASAFIQKITTNTQSYPIVRSRNNGLLLNSCFSLDTNVDGVADNWTLAGTTSSTVSASIELDGSLGHKKQVITMINPIQGDIKDFHQTLTPTSGYSIGDTLFCVLQYDWSLPDAVSASQIDGCGPIISLQGTLYGFPQVYSTMKYSGNSPGNGYVAMGTIVVPSEYPNIRINAQLRCFTQVPNGNYVLKLYRVGLINLTAMGITL